jgi:hypothetical protein
MVALSLKFLPWYVMLFKQVALEFTRLVSMDLRNTFDEGLDSHLSKLLEFYRAKSGGGMELKHLMEKS